jgi:hypothetical protein
MITLSTYAKRLNVCTSAISYGVFVLVKSTLQNMPGTNRMLSWMAMSVFASGVVLSGCGPAMTRPQRERNDLVKLRTTGDEHATAAIRKLVTRLMERTKAEYDQYNTGQRKVAPGRNVRQAPAFQTYFPYRGYEPTNQVIQIFNVLDSQGYKIVKK